MKIRNLERVNNHKVHDWLCDNIPNITPEQEDALLDLVYDSRTCPYYFYERCKRKAKPLMRLTLLPLIIFTLLIFMSMPFNYLVTGDFRYSESKFMRFYEKWVYSVLP